MTALIALRVTLPLPACGVAAGYSQHCAYWEAVVLTRKICLQLIAVFIPDPNTQGVGAGLVTP